MSDNILQIKLCVCFDITELKGPVGQILSVEKTMLAVEQNKVLMPPGYGRYVAWGFADHSLRIGNYDSDKAMLVCEEPFGEIVCCTCPSSRLIVTAGTSSVSFSIKHFHFYLKLSNMISWCV